MRQASTLRLCMDIGNTHIVGGVFKQHDILLRFRHATCTEYTSDQLGLFFIHILQVNQIDYHDIREVVIGSVVPGIDYSVRSACIKYFSTEPFFLKPGIKTGFNIAVQQPDEMGADRVANLIAAVEQFPGRHLAIIDFGTATTIDIVTREKDCLGGAIFPGIKSSMETLSRSAAKLGSVKIVKPKQALGKTTESQIQSGLYYEQLATIDCLVKKMAAEVLHGEELMIIGTGGFSHLYEKENIFHAIIPDLTLQGLNILYDRNQ